ncbi:hypothetical protein PG994_011405 [Apiospora phragmitis]|uniref:Uncharacterized protein n=1 Tax=Apiospora phragmitis TaxID=2905665 RepID=A0ABR1TSP6_9PEZI
MEEKGLSGTLQCSGLGAWFMEWHDGQMGIVASWQPTSPSTTRPASLSSPHHPEASITPLEGAWRIPYETPTKGRMETPLQRDPPCEDSLALW